MRPAASSQSNQSGSAGNNTGDSSQQAAKKEELERAKAEKQRKLQALAANNKAVQLGKAGKFEEAILAHEEAVQLDPENKQFRIKLISSLLCLWTAPVSKKRICRIFSIF